MARPGRRHDERSRHRRALRRRAGAFTARDAAAHEQDQTGAARGAGPRRSSCVGRIEPLAARADLTLKAGERALRDIRAALGSVPPLPSKQDYDEIVEAAQGGAGRADAEGAGAARRRRLAALGERRHPGAALRQDGGAQDGRGSRGDRARRSANCSSSGGRRPTCRARRAKRSGGASRRRTTRSGRAARRTSPAQDGSARREPGEEGRAVRARRGARRLDQLDSDRRGDQERCRPSGRPSAR